MRRLKEGYSKEDLLNFLKTKLGLLDSNEVFKSDKKDISNLTNSTITYLKNIKENGIRKYKTTKVNNAWLNVRGASATRRELKSRLPAYIFMYFTDGTFIEGSLENEIKLYKGAKIDKDTLKKKFDELEDDLSTFGLVNNYPVQNLNKNLRDGLCLLISLKSKDMTNNVQTLLNDSFVEDDSGLLKKINKFSKMFINAIKKPENVSLKDFTFISNSEIQMYWTKEETDIATEILNSIKPQNNKQKKEPVKNSEIQKTKKKSFNKTYFGKQAKEFIKDTSKLQNFEDARNELYTDWNDKDAAVVMSNVANIMKHTYTKDKAELTKRLRDMNLIERLNKTKKLIENKYDDLLGMFRWDLLENSPLADPAESLMSGLGTEDLLDLLDEVAPTYLGIKSVEDIYDILDHSTDPNTEYYRKLLDDVVANAELADSCGINS